MGTGEAAVTILSERGAPTPVVWTRLRPPASLMAELDPAEHTRIVQASPLVAEYGTPVDRDSAYERLLAKVAPPQEEPARPAARSRAPREQREKREEPSGLQKVLGSSIFRSFARSAASAAGREISRSLFGTAPRRRARTRKRW